MRRSLKSQKNIIKTPLLAFQVRWRWSALAGFI